jgi:glycosyltransferase involved in cell wall biosynthesis
MKKILLIAFYFNQTNEIASKRLRGLAKYLPQFGWEPIVIVPRLDNFPIYTSENLDFKVIETDYEDMIDKWLKKFKYISNKAENDFNSDLKTKFDSNSINPNNPTNLNNSINTNTLSNHNKSINANTPSNHDKSINTNTSSNNDNSINPIDSINSNTPISYNNYNKLKKGNTMISKVISIAGEFFAYPDGMKYWYKPAMEVSKEAIEVNDIKAIISSSWPITSHIIAKDLKKQYNIGWVADLRDLWNLNPYVNHTFLRNYFEKKLEIETLKTADILTTTTELANERLKNLHPTKKICTVMSGYDIEDITENNTPKNNDKLNFMYAGSLYGGKRDPTLLFKGINQLIEEEKIIPSLISLDFYGDSDGLEELAKKYKIEEIVNIHGSIPHKEVLKKQKESQALLLLSWNNKKEMIFLPGKIYEYLAAKRPVLSIGYEEGSLKNLIEKTNIGYHVSTIEEIKTSILKLYNNFKENKSLKYTGNNEVNKYSIISTTQKFAKILDSIEKKYLN